MTACVITHVITYVSLCVITYENVCNNTSTFENMHNDVPNNQHMTALY